ncbi:MAG TPA: hypothetical protein VG052_02395 [Puia sp.]|nr:hypothetical protein [Puia sp.]
MYLLLRDNKQSGPYSLDELKAKGLKAYDLVWVEGRSAAWRYPSEIAEMSSFAPAVEEQPFDRFYKKPAAVRSTAASESVVSSQPAVSSASGTSVPTTTHHPDEFSSTPRKRTIYVTMPGGAPVIMRETPPQAAREVYREPVRETFREPAGETFREAGSFREPVRETFHEPAREAFIERSGEIMPQFPPRKKVRILQPVAIGFCILVLLAAGIFIGLSIQKDGPFKLASRTGSTADHTRPIVPTTAQQLPVSPTADKVVTSTQTQQTTPFVSAPSSPGNTAPVTDRPVNKPPRATTPKQKEGVPKTQAILPVTVSDSSTALPTMLHREAVHRTDPAESLAVADKEIIKAGFANQVSVGTNKYEVGTFGGINHLQVTVTNRSAYALDLVVVELQYIQANKKIFKTENLYFHGISPGSALMLEAPKSSRGIQIQYKITSINSKELGLPESGI